MASSPPFLFLTAVLVLSITLQHAASAEGDHEAEVGMAERSKGNYVHFNPNNRRLLFPSLDCGGKCNARCSAHSRPNVCVRACNTCCYRCNCVPPGTSGNRELCGRCYTDMITHGNKPKCP
ncbi:unnamed protein product [Linum tenue]|uniref:Uncharacterized protein n=1 Tax=Linum tenue TaxID=586396 RepID=A0AAV0HPS0_9ROSI|nr:unnamed protein product [Linum tenue]